MKSGEEAAGRTGSDVHALVFFSSTFFSVHPARPNGLRLNGGLSSSLMALFVLFPPSFLAESVHLKICMYYDDARVQGY